LTAGRRGYVARVTSPRAQLDALVEDSDFPLSKAELLAIIESRDGAPELAEFVQPLADEHYADRAELRERIEEALGMPDATTYKSVLEEDKGELG
jgi:hypothetical protein